MPEGRRALAWSGSCAVGRAIHRAYFNQFEIDAETRELGRLRKRS